MAISDADIFPKASQFWVRWWGYPTVHAARRIKPTVLLVVHITGNSRLPSALGEATYSNRDGSGASFTFVTNRDGSIVQCLHPLTQTPWTNGDLMNPNTSLSTVKAMVGSNYNANEFCFMTCENVGYEPNGNPITAAQKETLAQLAAWGSKVSGLPINRSTVIGHRDINNVTRHNCPTSGDLDKFLAGIIARAKEIAGGLPDTSIEEDPAVIAELKAELSEWKQKARKYWQWIVSLRAVRDELKAQVADLDAEVADLEAKLGTLPQENADLTAIVKRLRGRLNTIKGKVATMATDIADD